VKELLVLGGDAFGTMLANRLRRLDHDWQITVVALDDSGAQLLFT
jgi:hypothetical protein